MKPYNITYLLGAGASVKCLPIYKRVEKSSVITKGAVSLTQWNLIAFEDRLKYFISDRLSQIQKELIFKPNIQIGNQKMSAQTILNNLEENLKLILLDLEIHISADTIAKKLWLTRNHYQKSTNKQNMKRLTEFKAALSAFFMFEQIMNPPDMRYDSFIATISQANRDLDKNIKIITWNYDIQFELAARSYFPEFKTFFQLQNFLNIYPRVEDQNNLSAFDLNKFGVVRLNGTAGMFLGIGNFKNLFLADLSIEDKVEVFRQILVNYYITSNNSGHIEETFAFSWEGSQISNEARNHAKKILKSTELLVIIGYSFPIFNKEVDDELVRAVHKTGLKIIIQSPDAIKLKETFMKRYSTSSINIETDTNVDQFYLPE